MNWVDEQSPEIRALVHEYGARVVCVHLEGNPGMDAGDLKFNLMVWRQRRQEEWLATQYVSARTVNGFRAAVGLPTAN